jgi:serine/threonine-protein kinase
MSQRLVPRRAASSSGAVSASAGDPTAEALRRLRMLCVFIAVAPPGKIALSALLMPQGTAQRDLLSGTAGLFALGMLGSGVVYWLLGNERIPRQRRLDIGFGYQVFLALVLALFRHQEPWALGDGFRDFSPVAVLVVVFAAFVPNPPARTLAAGLLAAAMDPLALVLSGVVLHNPLPPLGQCVGITIPAFGAAVVATHVSRVIHKLARTVDEARRLGSYRLVERLGEGGMGEVWRGEHELLARPAAIKLVRGDSAVDAGALTRFEREAQATAVLTSPHTIHLYDFGVADDGTFYYVMELLDGLDLEKLVQQHGPMPAERVAHILPQICESLEEAHHRGLVHRDIKPANIYVCRYGRQVDFVKVLDFGLVKSVGVVGVAELAPTVTVQGTIAGTPAFVAPEVVLGEEIDGRADVYSLGCVAYWLLTGLYVFETTTTMKMMLAHVHTAPVPPSQRTEIPIPPALEQLVLDCLEKDRARRPASADEVARRLEAIAFESPWARERAARWWQLHVRGEAAAA